MEKLVIILLTLMTFTGVSFGEIGKAIVTPLHLCMGVLMVYVLFFAKKSKINIQVSLLLLVSYIVLANTIIHTNTRITSVIYTVVFALEYLIMYHLMTRVNKQEVIKALGLIMFLFTINIGLGTILSLLNLDIGQGVINIYYEADGGGARPMGFSTEPSYSAFILSIVFLSFNHLRGHKVDKLMWEMAIAYLLCTIMMKSAYGFIFVGVILLDWFIIIFKRLSFNIKIVFFLMGLGLLYVLPMLVQNSNHESITRIKEVSTVMSDDSYDTRKKLAKLQEADGSAYARIGPTYLILNIKDELPFNLFIGAGAGEAGIFFKKFMSGVLIDGDEVDKLDMGIIPAFVFDYGILGSILLLFFFIVCSYNLSLPFWIAFLLILPNCNINTQLFWFGITMYAYVSFIKNNKDVEITEFTDLL